MNESYPDREAERREHDARISTTSFWAFFEKYDIRLRRYMIARTADSVLAEQIASETMMYAYDKWDHLLTMTRPDSWLFTVATNKLNRREAAYRKANFLREDLKSFEDDLKAVAAKDVWIETRMDIIVALRLLPRRQVEVITLHFFADQKLCDIATWMNVSEGTVKQYLSRGLARLRKDPHLQAAIGMARRIPA
jgi:RNA polymerase sigma-70 factor (ECF subfamily)